MRDARLPKLLLIGAASALALTLAACGQKSSAVAPRDQSSAASGDQARAPDPRDAPIPKIDGKPMWAANRKHTAEENAQYQFNKNGGDFGAKSESDYLTTVHAFIDKPPSDIQTLDRSNGDKLMYDPKGNIFAVVTKDGAPRTMFKPHSGASYWAEQKDRESQKSKNDSGGGDQS